MRSTLCNSYSLSWGQVEVWMVPGDWSSKEDFSKSRSRMFCGDTSVSSLPRLFMNNRCLLTLVEANMSPARPAGHQTQNSAKERTVCTSSPAILVAVDVRSRLSRPVTRLKWERERGSRHKQSNQSLYEIGIMAHHLARYAVIDPGIESCSRRRNDILFVLFAGLARPK